MASQQRDAGVEAAVDVVHLDGHLLPSVVGADAAQHQQLVALDVDLEQVDAAQRVPRDQLQTVPCAHTKADATPPAGASPPATSAAAAACARSRGLLVDSPVAPAYSTSRRAGAATSAEPLARGARVALGLRSSAANAVGDGSTAMMVARGAGWQWSEKRPMLAPASTTTAGSDGVSVVELHAALQARRVVSAIAKLGLVGAAVLEGDAERVVAHQPAAAIAGAAAARAALLLSRRRAASTSAS